MTSGLYRPMDSRVCVVGVGGGGGGLPDGSLSDVPHPALYTSDPPSTCPHGTAGTSSPMVKCLKSTAPRVPIIKRGSHNPIELYNYML